MSVSRLQPSSIVIALGERHVAFVFNRAEGEYEADFALDALVRNHPGPLEVTASFVHRPDAPADTAYEAGVYAEAYDIDVIAEGKHPQHALLNALRKLAHELDAARERAESHRVMVHEAIARTIPDPNPTSNES